MAFLTHQSFIVVGCNGLCRVMSCPCQGAAELAEVANLRADGPPSPRLWSWRER